MTGWQPIQTAPKDGTWVLTYERFGGLDIIRTLESDTDGGWNDVSGRRRVYPTHWMPLPEPPKS